jgi:dTDP-glucose 4,6-dehydratase
MRVLITGGAGFIGSHLCDYFLAKGHTVIAMDNLITGSVDNIRHLKNQKRFSFVQHNVSEHIHVSGSLDAVLHFASPASPVDYLIHRIPTMKVGSLGTHNALGVAKKKKAIFLLASTSEVYGDPQVSPQPESYWGHVNPVGPRAVYDEAKRFAEAITMAYHLSHGMKVRIVRIFNTYGPRMRLNDGRAIPNFISQALRGKPITIYGDGQQTRSFCYVSDLVEGIYQLLHSKYTGPVNLGNPGGHMTILTLAKQIVKATQTRSRIVRKPLPKDDPTNRLPDIRLARRLLHWSPRTPLHVGLPPTIAYFRETLYA